MLRVPWPKTLLSVFPGDAPGCKLSVWSLHWILYVIFSHLIIAERISARHWITDCGPGIGSCMYVCPSRLWNAIKAQHMYDGNSICTTTMHVFVHRFPSLYACVCMHACMHCSLRTSTWIIIRPKWGGVYFLVGLIAINNSGFCWKFLISDSALSRRTCQVWFSILTQLGMVWHMKH